MLVAMRDSQRVHARTATKGPVYSCPGCGQVVTLKQGIKVIHHFAHKPPVSCKWAAGETQGHLRAKDLFLSHFSGLGYAANVEYPIGAQRADVHVLNGKGLPFVFEIQHTSISPAEIATRTAGYFEAGAVATWIPVINVAKLKTKPGKDGDGFVVERYSPKPFERWLHGFNFGEIWFIDPSASAFWRGRLSASMIEVAHAEWHVPGGGTESAGGYSRFSKRWRTLTLTGPYSLADLKFGRRSRRAASVGPYNYPGGNLVTIAPK